MNKKKKALDMTIKQWQMMVDDPEMFKYIAYKMLGGTDIQNNCFLCDNLECRNCIEWYKDNTSNKYQCIYEKSPFKKWCLDRSEENTLLVLNHLKAEREKLA